MLNLLKFLKQAPAPKEIEKQVNNERNLNKMMPPNQPIGSIGGIESLVMFGAQIFGQIFSLFHHPTAPVPVSAAPQIIATLQATPGTTSDHNAVIAAAVNAAASTVQS